MRGVKYLESYEGCYACKSKVTATTETLGKCNRCNTLRRLDKCSKQTTAKIEAQSDSGLTILTCFSPVIEEICESDHVTIESLLFSKKFNAEHCNGIITSIHR